MDLDEQMPVSAEQQTDQGLGKLTTVWIDETVYELRGPDGSVFHRGVDSHRAEVSRLQKSAQYAVDNALKTMGGTGKSIGQLRDDLEKAEKSGDTRSFQAIIDHIMENHR